MKMYRKGFITVISLLVTFVSLLVSLFIIRINRTKLKNFLLMKEKIQTQLDLSSFIEDLKYKLNFCSLECNGCRYKNEKFFFDGRKIKTKYLKSEITYSLIDTRSKLLVRAIPENIILKIFNIKKLPIEKAFIAADSLMDWYDPDDITRPNGAECPYYKTTLNAKYCPRNNRAFQSIFELHNIRGFENFTEDDIRNFFTNYSDSSININTAQPNILKLFFNNAEIYDILNRRKAGICLDSTNTRNLGYLPSNISFFPFRVVEIHICSSCNEARTCAEAVIDFSFQDYPQVYLKEFRYLF